MRRPDYCYSIFLDARHFTNNLSMAESFQRQLDLVAGFLTRTLDSRGEGADERISATHYLEYCRQVLMLSDEQVLAAAGPQAMPVLIKMKLCHVVDVIDILASLAQDPFDQIPLQFKAELSQAAELALKAAVTAPAPGGLDLPVLLPIMKEYVLTRLHDTIVPDSNVKEWLSAMDCGDDTLEEEAWFNDFFPDSLEHKHIVLALQFLENEQLASANMGAAGSSVPGDSEQGGLRGATVNGMDGDGDVKMG